MASIAAATFSIGSLDRCGTCMSRFASACAVRDFLARRTWRLSQTTLKVLEQIRHRLTQTLTTGRPSRWSCMSYVSIIYITASSPLKLMEINHEPNSAPLVTIPKGTATHDRWSPDYCSRRFASSMLPSTYSLEMGLTHQLPSLLSSSNITTEGWDNTGTCAHLFSYPFIYRLC